MSFFGKLKSKIDEAASHDTPVPSLTAWDAPPSKENIYRFRKQRGVNLGSYFTLEKWLTPSLFQDIQGESEYDVCKQLGEHKARERLEKHWSTFIDNGDWQWMRNHGINAVRLPISYYHFCPGHPDREVQHLMKGTEFEPFTAIYSNAFACIRQVIDKAAQHDIGVLIDLHAAPGSQNGEHHSGLPTKRADFFNDSKHRSKTISILSAMVNTFACKENVIGIELLNEPKNDEKLARWYKEAISQLRIQCMQQYHLPLIIGDCWEPDKYTCVIREQKGASGPIILDHHLYRCFSPSDHNKPARQHAGEVHCDGQGPSYKMLCQASSALQSGIIIGEWSAALNPASLREGDHREQQKEWAYAQLYAYSKQCAGHYFWTLKKEGPTDVGWCLYSAIEQGVLPSGLGRSDPSRDLAQLQQRGHDACNTNYNGHCDYWQKNGGGKEMHHERYRDGFQQIFKDCIDFYHQDGDEIGLNGYWVESKALAYMAAVNDDRGKKTADWEFVHGGLKAIECFTDIVRA